MTDIAATVTQSTITATASTGEAVSVTAPSEQAVFITASTGEMVSIVAPSGGAVSVTASTGEAVSITAPLAAVDVTVIAGPQGLSAYEVAVADGFVGDEAAWLDSLVGAAGPTGPQGIQGIQGEMGLQGPQGIQGETGPQGDAATIEIGTVTAGTPLSITNGGTTSAAVFDFVIPSGDVAGPASAVDGNLASYDGATGKLIKDSGVAASSVITSAETVAEALVDYGPNLITNPNFDTDATGWNVGTGWAWEDDGAGGGWMRHTAGNTAALSQDGELIEDVVYAYSLNIGGGTAGSVTIMADDGDQFTVNYDEFIGFDFLSYLVYFGLKIKIIPSSDFDGYVDAIGVYRPPYVLEAKINAKVYGRRNAAWLAVTEEAPIDGSVYARQDGAWVEITGASGTFTTADSKTVTVSNGLITSIV